MNSTNYPSVLLFHTLKKTPFMCPPRFSQTQIEVRRQSPSEDSGVSPGCIVESSRHPDVAEIMAKLTASSQDIPQAMIAWVDTSRTLTPINIQAFPGLKILAIQDTHHGVTPLRWIVDYLRQESYDAVVVMNRQHGHVFASMVPHSRVYWIPSLLVEPTALAVPETRQEPLVMVGQLAEHHPYRRHIVSQVVQAGFPLRLFQCPQNEVGTAYNQAQAVLNVTLNGDANFRIFEVTAAASLLINDHLSPESGLERLFTPGVHLETYRDSDHLCQILKRVLADPEASQAMAEAGHLHYQKTLSRPLILKAFWDAVLNDEEQPNFTLKDDPRLHLALKPDHLFAYEALQQVQQQILAPRVLLQGTDAPEIRALSSDLNRLTFIRPADAAQENPLASYDAVIIPDGSTARLVAKTIAPHMIILESAEKQPAFSPTYYDYLPEDEASAAYQRQRNALDHLKENDEYQNYDLFTLWPLLERFDFSGKRVLEIGYTMPPSQASVLAKGASWTAVAEDPTACQDPLTVNDSYQRLDLAIQDAKDTLKGQFDFVVSFGVLQRTIPQEILDAALPLLAPGGQLFIAAWPLWTGADGWRSKAPLILPPSFPHELGWRHLLAPPASQYGFFKAMAGADAAKLARTYQADANVNRLFPASYNEIFSQYALEEKDISFFNSFDPNDSATQALSDVGLPASLARWRALFLKGKKPR